MAIYRRTPTPSFGANIAKALGTGISGGIESLADLKLQEMQEEKRRKAFGPTIEQYGLPEGFSNLPKEIQVQLLKNIGTSDQMGQLTPAIEEYLRGGAPQAPEAPSGMFGLDRGPEDLGVQGQPIQPTEEGLMPEQKLALAGATLTGKPGNVSRVLSDIAKEKSRAKTQKERMSLQKEENLWNYNKKFLDKLGEQSEAAYDTLDTLKEMETVMERGNLPDPLLFAAVDSIGKMLGIDNAAAVFGGDAEVMQALSKNFLKHITKIFGARPAEGVVKMFIQTFPSLRTTEHGKKLMMNVIKKASNNTLFLQDAADELIEKNRGVPSRDLQSKSRKLARSRKDVSYNELQSSMKEAIKYGKGLEKTNKQQQKLVGKTLQSSQMSKAEGMRVELADGRTGRVVNGKFVEG